jgi:hypothetical protein
MQTMNKKTEIAQPYEPTPKETAAIESLKNRRANKKPSPSLKLTKTARREKEVVIDHQDLGTGSLLFMEAIGSTDFDFMDGFIRQVINIGSQGNEPDENGMNFVLSMVRGIEPRDQLEAMLALQMAAIHNATMTFSRRLAHIETIPQQDSANNALNKLARTFTTQIETLKRYRSTGEQKVTVQHVTVNDGGQAVIGHVSTGAGENKREELPHAKQITDASITTMPCPLETVREAVPVSSS